MTSLASRIAKLNRQTRLGFLLHGPADADPPKGKRRVRREDPVHISIKNYLEITLPDEFIVHHSRNGGLSKAENGRAKAMGAKEGFPDLMILGSFDFGTLTPMVLPTGWLIEVKTDEKGSDLSAAQRKLHRKLKALGWKVGVARSIDDARALVIEWGLPSSDHLVVKAREKAGR